MFIIYRNYSSGFTKLKKYWPQPSYTYTLYSLIICSGLVASGQAYPLESRVQTPARAGHFSMVIPPSGLRLPTCCYNTILDRTAKLFTRGASAGSMNLSIRNEASQKNLTRPTNGQRLAIYSKPSIKPTDATGKG